MPSFLTTIYDILYNGTYYCNSQDSEDDYWWWVGELIEITISKNKIICRTGIRNIIDEEITEINISDNIYNEILNITNSSNKQNISYNQSDGTIYFKDREYDKKIENNKL